MTYRMIGIDLDGTLLNSEGRVSPGNAAAVRRAITAGVTVVPCTGRGWCESASIRHAFADESNLAVGVFVTGAAISNFVTGAAVNVATFEPGLALEIVEYLWHAPEAVLVFRDTTQADHDYLVTGAGKLTRNTRWWFEQSGATVVHKSKVTLSDLSHALRIGVVADSLRMQALCEQADQTFGHRVSLHHFEAVPSPGCASGVHVLEIFAEGVDKWRGLTWLAARDGVPVDQIAAIGDQINDTSMLKGAGCGVAMANAVEPVLAIADHVTLGCDADGVAYAIDQLLSGAWRPHRKSSRPRGA